MKKLALVALAALASTPAIAQHNPKAWEFGTVRTAGDLVLRCSTAYMATDVAGISDAYASGYCMGITNIMGYTAYQQSDDTLCMPGLLSPQQLVHIFVDFVRRHKELEDRKYPEVFEAAIIEAFPCPNKQAKQ